MKQSEVLIKQYIKETKKLKWNLRVTMFWLWKNFKLWYHSYISRNLIFERCTEIFRWKCMMPRIYFKLYGTYKRLRYGWNKIGQVWRCKTNKHEFITVLFYFYIHLKFSVKYIVCPITQYVPLPSKTHVTVHVTFYSQLSFKNNLREKIVSWQGNCF